MGDDVRVWRIMRLHYSIAGGQRTPSKTSGPKVTYASGPEVQAMFVKRGRIDYPWMARSQYRTGSGIFVYQPGREGANGRCAAIYRARRFGFCRGCRVLPLPLQARTPPGTRSAGHVYSFKAAMVSN